MFRIRRGPIGGMRPMTQFVAPQSTGPSPEMDALLAKIASLENALGIGAREQPFVMPPGGTPSGRSAPAGVPSSGGGYNPNADPNRGTRFAGASGFNPDGTLRLAPDDRDAATQMAKYPGRYTWSGARTQVPTAAAQVGSGRGDQITAAPSRGPAFTPPADRAPGDWKASGWTLAPAGEPASGLDTFPASPGGYAPAPAVAPRYTAPPPMMGDAPTLASPVLDMGEEDWRNRGWTLAQ